MKKVVLIQCPEKFQEIIPIFCKECLKHGIFDHIYIATDSRQVFSLPKECTIISLTKDMQFASNVLYAMRFVKEPFVLLCCEDHVMISPHSETDFEQAYEFVKNNSSVGMLRLTCHSKVSFENNDNGFASRLNGKYKYYISLQPSIWRREYLVEALENGEDAWQTELSGSKRAKKSHRFSSFCVRKSIFFATNFFKSGKYLRHYFVDYAAEHDIQIMNQFQVYDKKNGIKRVVDLKDYS